MKENKNLTVFKRSPKLKLHPPQNFESRYVIIMTYYTVLQF